MKKVNVLLGTIAVAATVAIPALSQAQFARAEDAVKYRQSALTVMATHLGRIGAVVKGEVPHNADAVKADFAVFKTVSALPWTAFGENTAGGKAKDAVWKDPAEFQEHVTDFQSKVTALEVAVNSGDLDQLKKAFGNTGASCKACHDDFRAK